MNATVQSRPSEHGFLARAIPFEQWSARQPVLVPAEVEDPIAVGEEVVVYHSQGHLFGEVVGGPRYTAVEALFGRAYGVYDVRVGDVVFTCHTMVAVRRAAFEAAWHVYNAEGRIIAGGPRISRERAEELAVSMGGTAQQG